MEVHVLQEVQEAQEAENVRLLSEDEEGGRGRGRGLPDLVPERPTSHAAPDAGTDRTTRDG